MITRSVGPIAIALLMLPAAARAQICTSDTSFSDCLNTVGAAVLGELADVNTGSASGEGTATDDFNPRLQVSAETVGVSGDGGDGITLSWGDFIRKRARDELFGTDNVAENAGQHHKLVVKLEQAELFQPLSSAINDDALREQFTQSLDDFDNVLVDFRLSLDSERFGRDLQRNSDFVDAIQSSALASMADATAREMMERDPLGAEDLLDQLLQESGAPCWDCDELTSDQAAAFVAAAEAADREIMAFGRVYEDSLRAQGLFDLVDLVNNQPQLVLSVRARVRDDLAGPDERSLRFSYELGGANVNDLRRFRRDQTAFDADRGAQERLCPDTSTCLRNYVQRNGDRIKAGGRFSASLAFVSKSAYDFNDSGVQLSLPSERSLVAELGYGRYLGTGLADLGIGGKSRIDLAVSYEDVKDDPARQDRTLAKFTFSQEVSDGLFLTLGLVWASKPEYRGQVDEEVSARAGINYKLRRQ